MLKYVLPLAALAAMTAPASERHPFDPGAAPGHEPSIPVLRPLLPTASRLLPSSLGSTRSGRTPTGVRKGFHGAHSQ